MTSQTRVVTSHTSPCDRTRSETGSVQQSLNNVADHGQPSQGAQVRPSEMQMLQATREGGQTFFLGAAVAGIVRDAMEIA